VICDRCQREVSCHILTTDSWHQFLLCPDTSLGPWWDKCLNYIGGCVEVWCIPSASHVPFRHLSYNKVLSISVCYLSLCVVIYAGTYLLIGCKCTAYLLLFSKQCLLMHMAEVGSCFLGSCSLISQCRLSVDVFPGFGRLILLIH